MDCHAGFRHLIFFLIFYFSLTLIQTSRNRSSAATHRGSSRRGCCTTPPSLLCPAPLLPASPRAERGWRHPSIRPPIRPSVRAAGAGRAPRACQGQMVFASGARSQLSAARRDACGSCRRSRRCQTRGICCARPYTCPWAAAARRRLEGRRKIAAPSGRNLKDKQQWRNPPKNGKK